MTEYCYDGCCVLRLNFTWMPQIFPTVEIIPLAGANWTLVKALGNIHVELPFTYRAHSCWYVVVKPFTNTGKMVNQPQDLLMGHRLKFQQTATVSEE